MRAKQVAYLLACGLIFSAFASARAEETTNKIASNRIATNRIAANRLSANRLSSNRLSANTAATRTGQPGEGAASDIVAIELPDGTRLSR
jgi:hypothetical protein